ncbi:MAG: hypothetical protein LUO93_00665 [Methanomicrobiales archaeon]|nr:hypothetical protein [Methanomicrobiales archaeon]
MTVGELRESLEGIDDHVDVIVRWRDRGGKDWDRVDGAGIDSVDEEGVSAFVIDLEDE